MKLALLLGVSVITPAAILYVLKRRIAERYVSDQWLQDLRQGERVEYHGVTWNAEALRQ